jgi:hypothetical protein
MELSRVFSFRHKKSNSDLPRVIVPPLVDASSFLMLDAPVFTFCRLLGG